MNLSNESFVLSRRIAWREFGGGTAEVLRDMVAQMGLGLPREPRRT